MPLLYFLPPLGAVLIWSGNMTINQLTVGTIAPSSIAFLRWVLALAVLTPFVLPAAWRHRQTLRREWPKLAVLGLLGMGLWQGLAYVAAETTTATNMGILAAMVPLLTVLLSALILREAPSRGGTLGGLLALFGVLVLLGRGDPLTLLDLQVALGDLLMVVAATCYALYGVMLKRWPLGLPPWVVLYAQVVFAVLFLLPPYLLGPMTPVDDHNVWLILYAGIPASIVTTFLWMRAIRQIGASQASIFINLMPLFSALIAMLFLGERIALFHLVGGLLVLAGVIMAQTLTQPLGRKSPNLS
ncbi:DMT family transporter [Halomonas sp. MCCC 1A17488]|uniref:DMT family transporter n=1 Tax=Billgrantia sulfidoxydans TaxID=2733484 RepID=A0ABX7W8K1_9GAMM|nr:MULTISPECIES: DMT family transporter [Halomonas]MCE8017590.1 DMT family transporter [Halomonas sp. MCCC 1A17488]MCG3240923.1 DMT family transporter [Halomonas sp. MCCC 1A17488]QPP48794.1 DMT family transporter [Halomonas sp. SS10-MC5]QTP56130.1 DMT family transporter [Halomonas sulfidoxydans]